MTFLIAQRRHQRIDVSARSGDDTWGPEGGMDSDTDIYPTPDALSNKANILIDEDCNARLADFGLLTIVSDPTVFTTSSSVAACGTTRWMSPELLHPSEFGLKDHRPTIESDCYALGMVIYEVLSGKIPFATSLNIIVQRMIVDGGRPERPGGVQGSWFTNDLWGMLNCCWATQPKSRPGIRAVFECLEQISATWKPPAHQVDEDTEKDEDEWDLTAIVVSFFVPLQFWFLRTDTLSDLTLSSAELP